ncbi:POK19 protein, partial [Passerina amoena]|nr:POK19 protein [Passerina amoena]
ELCRSISWICPLLGIMTEDLAMLFNLLRSCEDLNSQCTITPEANVAIQKVSKALTSRQAHHVDSSLPFCFAVLGKSSKFYGIILQWDPTLKDQLLIIECVFQSHQPIKTITTPQDLMARLITKARAHLWTLAGCDFTCICLLLTLKDLDTLLQTNKNLQFPLDSYPGQISTHFPKCKLLNSTFNLVSKSLKSRTPLKALRGFTDGS